MNEPIPPAMLAFPHRQQYVMHIAVGDHSARHIRRIVRSFLLEWGMPELSDAVELAVTELIANVVRHVPDRRCGLFLLRQPAGVRVEVSDSSCQLPDLHVEFDAESETGRGLVLLDAVTDKWGVTRAAGGGKAVWFECSRTPARN
ncbi:MULTISPECIES: ATP-binding protein [unclassified Streptomyces]|uniref:ATP-binding protein n=1 Tax=unclassified Streptomyces TaxID=2593676 RepID=UPI00403C52B4